MVSGSFDVPPCTLPGLGHTRHGNLNIASAANPRLGHYKSKVGTAPGFPMVLADILSLATREDVFN